ncbi:1-acyl-sn-glycerol-3-phosphate acyltransferase [Sphingomonas lutea]|uniref:1-acyl-sn-glycerol-3-phosphate acyltransferase n=1 Tax=Sphingomonas lutea TaxID=1045317 RepID=A0A7G9SGW5_9SPHN|nr:1-acyl-sn-glycerol-3-phosphate acyltransferase [Sphingomonas lutea]QNN67090.1 1-acyl-sn-glycerol-3-phosphate acyltransferase [Sphingomonas lutea]
MPARVRAGRRVLALVLLFVVCAPLHLATKWIAGRSPWPRRFLAAAAWLIGIRVRLTGRPLRPHSLLIVNHTSWLDILILGGGTGCAFVSKDRLGHGFIHWLADQQATVYVKRSHVKGAKDQATAIARALEGDRPVALFPEGTTGPGTHLLPFRSTLLEAANFAAKDVEIRPVAIDFGEPRAAVGWYQEPGKRNVLRILGRRGTLPVTIHLLDPLDRGGDRKQLTGQARSAIAAALGFKSVSHSPIAGPE